MELVLSQGIPERGKIRLKEPILLLGIDHLGDLFGDQGSVAAGAVVHDAVDLEFVLHGSVYDFNPCPRSSLDPACR